MAMSFGLSLVAVMNANCQQLDNARKPLNNELKNASRLLHFSLRIVGPFSAQCARWER
jgi:hypothetical protein